MRRGASQCIALYLFLPLWEVAGYVCEGAAIAVAVAVVISVLPGSQTRHVGREVIPKHSNYSPSATPRCGVVKVSILLLFLFIFLNDHRQTAAAATAC